MIVISHYAEWWAWFTPSDGNAELFRLGMTKLGDYGAALFFLFSGYGLVKSLKGRPVSLPFVWKRIRTVYLPYLAVMGIIEALSGGFSDWKDFGYFVSGYDHWYMFVLFLFYLAFLLIWTFSLPSFLRVLLFSIFTYLLSWKLYTMGMAEFWYCSNFAFPLGLLIGEYEKTGRLIADKIGWILIPVLTVFMILIIRSGLGLNGQPLAEEFTAREIWMLIGAQFCWCLLAVFCSAKWPYYGPILKFIGKNSLYIYLTHTFVFMRCVNSMECGFGGRFAAAAVLTLAVSAVCWGAVTLLESLGRYLTQEDSR